ncbi:DUF3592 domain-containing protein [Chitinolyticbacter meiyuanensis]|uniref:DUF3592 domain-containing protein n=1 Tax=Chitinolyticbacter meiyuanensis TaxID=682798 RepID=UPI0011E5F43E|nr:DUF3592 domain-containing protein [Chitinolyticbacter meiyuanensis]
MVEYLKQMVDLTLRKELQGIHFFATLYVAFVLGGSLWQCLRQRRWSKTRGRLLRVGIRALGETDGGASNRDYVPDALYLYQVDDVEYQGTEISVWKMSASGLLKNTAYMLPKKVTADEHGNVDVYYNPKRPKKSLLLRPGPSTLIVLAGAMVGAVGFYVWKW